MDERVTDRRRYIALENTFPDNPKTLAIGPFAAYLYICGLCYCDRHQTDGFIPAQAVVAIALQLEWETEGSNDLLRLLEANGMWERVLLDGCLVGWNVHDYLNHQLSKEAFASLSKKRADAGRKGGLASAKRRKQTASKRKQSNLEVEVEVEVDKDLPSVQPVARPPENGRTDGTAIAFDYQNILQDMPL